jgi:hypothetical protein
MELSSVDENERHTTQPISKNNTKKLRERQSEMENELSQLPSLNSEIFEEEPPLFNNESTEPNELSDSFEDDIASWSDDDDDDDESTEDENTKMSDVDNENLSQNDVDDNNNNKSEEKKFNSSSEKNNNQQIPEQIEQTQQIKENMSSEELAKVFRDFYVVELTDSYANELNELRKEEGFDARKVTLLIDCMEQGIDVFSDFEKQLMMKK